MLKQLSPVANPREPCASDLPETLVRLLHCLPPLCSINGSAPIRANGEYLCAHRIELWAGAVSGTYMRNAHSASVRMETIHDM